MGLRHKIAIIVIIGFFYLPGLGNAQITRVDSLENLLKKQTRDHARIGILNELAYAYSKGDVEKSIRYASQALELALAFKDEVSVGYSQFILGNAFQLINSDTAVYFYNKSLSLYTQLNCQDSIIKPLNNLGVLYKNRGEYKSSLEIFFKALKLAESIKDKVHLGFLYNNIGQVFRHSGSYETATEYFIKSLNINEELKNKEGIALCNGNLGNLYMNQKQFGKAIEYYENARTIFKELEQPVYEAHALHNLGLINSENSNYAEAVMYFDLALDIYISQKNELGSAIVFANKAKIYSEEKNYSEALLNSLKAIELLKKYNQKDHLSVTYVETGSTYLNLGDFQNAYRYINYGLKLAKETGNKQREVDGLEGLYKYHEKLRDFEDALSYFKLYSNLKDSLFNEEVSKRMSNILSNAEIEKREKEKDLLEERIRRQELENKALIGGAVFLLLFAVYFFNTTQQKKRTNKLLSAQNEEIYQKQQQIIFINESLQKSQKQLHRVNEKLQKLNAGLENTVKERTFELQKSHEELDTFLYQSSHALRRPIVNIMGLIQIARIEPDFRSVPPIYDKIDDTTARMDLMLKKLVMVSEINLSEQTPEVIDFAEVIAEAVSIASPDLLYKNVDVIKHVYLERTFKADRRLISIIMQNLIENSIHFHSEERDRICIRIGIKDNKENLFINVHDNGIGIPKDLAEQVFDMFHVASTRSKGYGLGLYIVKKAVEKLKGRIDLDSRENEFTNITISLPYK